MPDGRIGVYPGRLKTFPFSWHQGASSSSPPIDCTGGECEVIASTLPNGAKPDINPVNLAQGTFELIFPANITQGLKSGNTYSLTIALTYASNPGYSPNPVKVGVMIL